MKAESPVSHDPSEISLICWFDAQETKLTSVKKFVVDIFQESFISKWNIAYLLLKYFETLNIFAVSFAKQTVVYINKNKITWTLTSKRIRNGYENLNYENVLLDKIA